MAKNNNQPLLKSGSTGSDVKKMQQSLIKAGYDVGKAGADGIYGPDTTRAVKQYQKDNGLAMDGIAGRVTLGDLYATAVTADGDVANSRAPINSQKQKAEPKQDGDNGSVEDTVEDTTVEDTTVDNGGFNYVDTGPSDIVTQANELLQQHNASRPGAYQSQWDAQIKEYMDKIMNREKFSYNFNEDALYQMYKDQYIQQGQMAMMDTMGQAAAMTGGYGNSYAQTVGQQAYNQQLTELNNIIPELQQMAFEQYAYEGDQLYNQYGLLMDQENMDYGRYMDSYNMWADERDYLTGRYDTERNFDYNQRADNYDKAWNEYVYNNNMEYQQGRDQVGDQNDSYNRLANLISSTGYKPTADELKAAGMTESQANALKNAYNNSTSGSGAGNSGGTPSGYDNGKLTTSQVKMLQEALGITADGKWGDESFKAAGNLTADEALKAYERGTLKSNNQPSGAVNSYGLTESRADEIYDWLEKALTNKNIGASFDPIKLINGSSFFTSDAERNFAKELLSVFK